MTRLIRVAARSEATLVAGAIAGVLRDDREAIVQAVGANAVNQMVKAAAIARSYLAADGIDLYLIPDFAAVEMGGEERTGLRLNVYVQPVAQWCGGRDSHRETV